MRDKQSPKKSPRLSKNIRASSSYSFFATAAPSRLENRVTKNDNFYKDNEKGQILSIREVKFFEFGYRQPLQRSNKCEK